MIKYKNKTNTSKLFVIYCFKIECMYTFLNYGIKIKLYLNKKKTLNNCV